MRLARWSGMPIKKLDDPPDTWANQWNCRDPEHYPPMNIVLEPGRYENTCPNCGARTVFRVDSGTLRSAERAKSARTTHPCDSDCGCPGSAPWCPPSPETRQICGRSHTPPDLAIGYVCRRPPHAATEPCAMVPMGRGWL